MNLFLGMPIGWATPAGWVTPYQLCLLAAMLVGAALFVWQLRLIDVPWSKILSTLPLAVVIPVTGARLFENFVYSREHFLEKPITVLNVLKGGLSSHGAVLGLVVLAFVLAKLYSQRVGSLADRLTFWALLGLVATRVGDHIHQEIIGLPTDLPWAMQFPRHGDDLLRHPANLYEIGLVVLLFIATIVLFIKLKKKKPGLTASLIMTAYFIGRLAIDAIRDVPVFMESPRITVSQIACVIFIALGGLFVFMTSRGLKTQVSSQKDKPPVKKQSGKKLLIKLAIGFVVSGLLGMFFKTLVLEVDYAHSKMHLFFWIHPVVIFTAAVSVFVLSLTGGLLGRKLDNSKFRKLRAVFSVFMLVLALLVTIFAMTIMPMGAAALCFLLIALALPFFHTIKDLVAFWFGAIGASIIYTALILGGIQQSSFPVTMVPLLYGLAAVLVSRVVVGPKVSKEA